VSGYLFHRDDEDERDYGDVPPTRGIFKGQAKTDLSVAVKVIPSAAPPPPENQGADEVWLPSDSNTDELSDFEQVRQKRKEQQQQQQQ
jgi:hypothetical protein